MPPPNAEWQNCVRESHPAKLCAMTDAEMTTP